MNKKIFSLLGVASVVVGMTTGATSAQASTLGPGVVSVETDGGIFFSNNAVDFTIDNTAEPSPGVAGTGTVTTPVNPLDSQAGVFGIVSGFPDTYPSLNNIDEVLDKLMGRRFPESQGNPDGIPDFLSQIRIEDFEILPRIDNDITYTLPQPAPLLHFDTDGDGAFGAMNSYNGLSVIPGDGSDTDDFTFYATTFKREVGGSDGAFNVIFEFDGFFRDGSGEFKDTPAEFALFNGVTGVDPMDLAPTTNFVGDFEFQAGGDGRIGTLGRQAPEPGTILGLTALAGLGLSSRLKRKGK